MKQFRLVFVLLTALIAANMQAKSLHFVLAADTGNTDSEFAATCNSDLQNMRREADTMALFGGFGRPVIHLLQGSDFSKKGMTDLLNALPALGAEDVLIFYYAGAGFCDAQDVNRDAYRWLRLRDGAFSTATIQSMIEAKKARLNILLIDACGQKVEIIARSDHYRSAGTNIYQKLLSASGTLTVFASACGEFAYCNRNGGLMTYFFLLGLDHFFGLKTPDMCWQKLLDWTLDQVEQYSDQQYFRTQNVQVFKEKLKDSCKP